MASGLVNGVAQAAANAVKKIQKNQVLGPPSLDQSWDNYANAVISKPSDTGYAPSDAGVSSAIPATISSSKAEDEGDDDGLPSSDVVVPQSLTDAAQNDPRVRNASSATERNREAADSGAGADTMNGLIGFANGIGDWFSKNGYQRANEISEKWKSGEEEYEPISDKIGDSFVSAMRNAGDAAYDSPIGDYLDKQVRARFIDPETGGLKSFTDFDFSPTPNNIASDSMQQRYANALENIKMRQEEDADGNPIKKTDVSTLNDKADVSDKGVVAQLDDGYTPDSEYGVYMTGEQYINYRNEGLPGLDVDEIDPEGIYNKQHEFVNNGFIPLITEDTREDFDNLAAAQDLADLWNTLGQARDYYTTFTIDYDGRKFSGDEFLDGVYDYSDIYNEQFSDSSRYTEDASQTNEYSVPLITRGYRITESDGEVTEEMDAPEWTGLARNYPQGGYEDYGDMPLVVFPDGKAFLFDDVDDVDSSIDPIQDIALDGETPNGWVNVDPMELSDGTKLSAADVNKIYDNMDDYADYGFLNIGKPAQRIGEVPESIGDLLPWTVDLISNSAPFLLSYPTNGASYVLSAVPMAYVANRSGINPQSYDMRTGTYKRLAENLTDDQLATSTLAYAFQPFGEELGGSIGTKAKGNSMVRNLSPGKRWVFDTASEGVEEIVPGSIFEELLQYTVPELYANQMYYDADGNLTTLAEAEDGNANQLAIDSQGKRIRDTSTSGSDRFWNFVKSAPSNFIGGAYLGGLMGIPGYVNNRRTYDKNDPYRFVSPSKVNFDFDEETKRKYQE